MYGVTDVVPGEDQRDGCREQIMRALGLSNRA
jgi:hypothetical protein